MADNQPSDFEKLAAEETDGSTLAELWGFLRHNKKWWLLPILVVLLGFGVIAWLSLSGAAPFIYTLF